MKIDKKEAESGPYLKTNKASHNLVKEIYFSMV